MLVRALCGCEQFNHNLVRFFVILLFCYFCLYWRDESKDCIRRAELHAYTYIFICTVIAVSLTFLLQIVKPFSTPSSLKTKTKTNSARVLAKKHGLNLATISGTGNFGRVTESDVLAATGQAPKGKVAEEASTGMGMDMREAPDMPDGPKVLS